MRGVVELKHDDHALWSCVQKRVSQHRSWEEIAREIGCDIDSLVHWANWVYQPPAKPKVGAPSIADIPTIPTRDLPQSSPMAMSKQFLAWRRARDGARKTREAMET